MAFFDVVVVKGFVFVFVVSVVVSASDRLHQRDVGRPPGVVLEPLNRGPVEREKNEKKSERTKEVRIVLFFLFERDLGPEK